MPVFILEKVSKSYKVEKTSNNVLKDITISFPQKGLVSLVGKSGCGKSTLLNILMGIEKPTDGKVCFQGQDIFRYSDKKFSKYHLSQVSMIFQHYNLFENLSVIENIIVPLKMKGIRTKKAVIIAKKNLAQFHLENLAKQKVKNLSGGEKQRVAIIRSIVTCPKVLLCDEPTGALDRKNSMEIMEILQELSKKILVVVVSHNRYLVEKYSDQIVTMKDGKIDNSKIINKLPDNDQKNYIENSYKESWIKLFLKTNLKKNFWKNLFSLFACSIGFSSVFICVGFLVGSKESQNEAILRNLSVGYATVSSVETVELQDSPLNYSKTVRPELIDVDEEFDEFSTIRVENNISYLISNYPSISYESETYTNFQMLPVYDLSLTNYGEEMLVEGRKADNSFGEILVNREFEKLIGGNAINKTILLKNETSISYKTKDDSNPLVNDSLFIEKPMKIVGIINEFPFLNTPKIYYSYEGGINFLKSQTMENVTKFLGRNYTFNDYLNNCENDDIASSYSSYIFLTDLSEIKPFFEKIKRLKNSSLEVNSQIFEIQDTYIAFISSFSKALITFSIIAFIGVNLILGMISLSSFLENKKTAAILTCLGSRNSSIYKIHLLENYLLVAISFISSLFLSNFLQGIINPLVSKHFSLNGLIKIPFESFLGIRFGFILMFACLVIVLSALFTVVPMMIYRSNYITAELRDE